MLLTPETVLDQMGTYDSMQDYQSMDVEQGEAESDDEL